jgi:phenylalanyl-tRNA synthetase beta chain
MTPLAGSETDVADRPLRQLMVDRGYREVITYSFVDPDTVARLDPAAEPLPLANPLSREQSVMRPDLFAGLLETAAANQARQNERLRLFELGRVFPRIDGAIQQRDALGGLVAGPVDPPHWAGDKRGADFFDAKGDVEALLARAGVTGATFEAAEHPALHPGQAARITLDGAHAGWLGALHPALAEPLAVTEPVVVFQLDLAAVRASGGGVPAYRPVSRLPMTRRDLAVVVPEAVTADALSRVVAAYRGEIEADLALMDWRIFDVYTGKGVEPGHKSIGLALTLQPRDETPTDDRIEAVVSALVERLSAELGAQLRG